jgi:DNA-directed RNA polymerase subunit N (RpoN/RPB10)
MIIPIRCMNCGGVIADKWRKYQELLKQRKGNKNQPSTIYIDATNIPNTPEKQVLDMLQLRRECCRKHFLTHVDLLDKI